VALIPDEENVEIY